MQSLIDRVYHHLLNTYRNRGVNFFFKSSNLAKNIGVEPRTIGKACKELYRQGKLECWTRGSSSSPKTWKTLF